MYFNKFDAINVIYGTVSCRGCVIPADWVPELLAFDLTKIKRFALDNNFRAKKCSWLQCNECNLLTTVCIKWSSPSRIPTSNLLRFFRSSSASFLRSCSMLILSSRSSIFSLNSVFSSWWMKRRKYVVIFWFFCPFLGFCGCGVPILLLYFWQKCTRKSHKNWSPHLTHKLDQFPLSLQFLLDGSQVTNFFFRSCLQKKEKTRKGNWHFSLV